AQPDAPIAQRRIRFDVAEAFRGVSGATVDVLTGLGGGDCGYPFRVGERYLVYAQASTDGSTLDTGICTRTRPIGDAAEDLAYARSVRNGRVEGGTVTGTVQGGDRQDAPLAGVPVVLEGGRARFRAISDGNGLFAIANLLGGAYAIAAEPPPNTYAEIWPKTVTLADPRACAEVSIVVRADGRAVGRVVDSRGQPIADLTVGLFPQAALTRGPGNADVVEVRTALAGRYAFARLAPGRYLVGMNLQTDLKGLPVLPRIFYPGVSAASAARPFDLARGQ